jgi:hypothetical protein
LITHNNREKVERKYLSMASAVLQKSAMAPAILVSTATNPGARRFKTRIQRRAAVLRLRRQMLNGRGAWTSNREGNDATTREYELWNKRHKKSID